MSYTQQAILRDKNGDAIPQIWDVTQNKFVPYTNNDIKLLQSELETIKTNQLSGDQKVQLPGSEELAQDVTVQGVKSELEAVKSELVLVKSELATIDETQNWKIYTGVLTGVVDEGDILEEAD